MKPIYQDYTLAKDQFSVEVDASCHHKWYVRFYYWLRKQKPPIRAVTITLPVGTHGFKIRKIDSSPNPVVIEMPPIATLDCQYESWHESNDCPTGQKR